MKKKKKLVFIVIGVVVFLLIAGIAGFFAYRMTRNRGKDSEAIESQSGEDVSGEQADESEESSRESNGTDGEDAGKETEESSEQQESTDVGETADETTQASTTASTLEEDLANQGFMPVNPPEEESEEAVNPSQQGTGSNVLYVVNCNDYITLRESPSSHSAEVARIPLGASVTYLGRLENGFCYVQFGGYTGYALVTYLNSTQ